MKVTDAVKLLHQYDKKGVCVFTKHDLIKLFPDDAPKALSESLNRLVKAGILSRACRGIYVNQAAESIDGYLIEHIAIALRRGCYNYVSLESMLSEYGVISQIPIDRLTVMTTGRRGIYKTKFGVIEFTHTKRSVNNILDHIKIIPERPLRIATEEAAIRDLLRVGRNINLLPEGLRNHGE